LQANSGVQGCATLLADPLARGKSVLEQTFDAKNVA
jgi:hypothetical protein